MPQAQDRLVLLRRIDGERNDRGFVPEKAEIIVALEKSDFVAHTRGQKGQSLI